MIKMDKLTFENLPKAMEDALSKMTLIQEELERLKLHFEPKEPVELMSRKEVAEFFKIDISTVHNWTKKGKLKSFGIEGRVYYKRSDVQNSLIELL